MKEAVRGQEGKEEGVGVGVGVGVGGGGCLLPTLRNILIQVSHKALNSAIHGLMKSSCRRDQAVAKDRDYSLAGAQPVSQ